MKLTRIFHPIGQGGFYTEKLTEEDQTLNVVFDCGGFDSSGQNKMKKYLDSYINYVDDYQQKQKIKIDAVFISHFHADHINGLQYLLDNTCVRYLIMPQLSEDLLLEAFVYNYCQTGTYNRVNQFLLRLYVNHITNNQNSYNQDTTIIQISNGISNTSVQMGVPGSGVVSHILDSGTEFYFSKWKYIPYNSKIDLTKIRTLKSELERVTGPISNIEDLPQLIKKITVKKCKDIYSSVFGEDHNSYSMTLFSGNQNSSQINKKSPNSNLDNPNCLYTGDLEPCSNINDLKDIAIYGQYWDQIASIQVPHHGSQYNYHKDLYEYPIRGIISVGNNNSHKHPNIDTLLKIHDNGCEPIIVTDDKSSMKIYQYIV